MAKTVRTERSLLFRMTEVPKRNQPAEIHHTKPEKERNAGDDARREWSVLSGPEALDRFRRARQIEREQVEPRESDENEFQLQIDVCLENRARRDFHVRVDAGHE